MANDGLLAEGLYPRGFKRENKWRWPLIQASKLVTLRYGKALKAGEREPGSVAVYGTNGQCGWHNEALQEGPGIILGRKGQGPLGVEWSEAPFWVIDTAYYVDINSSNLDQRYFFYLIKYIGLNHLKDGTSNPSLSRSTFDKLLLPVPPKDEQKEIAGLIRLFDEKVGINVQINTTLESMAQTLFKSWFVDFDPVIDNALAAGNPIPDELKARAEARAALGAQRKPLPDHIRQQFPDRFVLTEEMGWVPEGWVIEEVASIIERLKVKERYKKGDVSRHGRTPVFEQGADILLGYHNRDGEIDANPSNPAFIFGDHTCVTKLSTENFSVSQNVIPLRGSKRNSYWTYYAIRDKQQFEEYRRHWMELAVKTVLLPARELADVFAEQICANKVKQARLSRQNNALAEIRDTLLPKLLSGELRIPEAEKQVEEAI